MSHSLTRVVLAGSLFALVLAALSWQADAQDGVMTAAEVEGRIVARLVADGRIEFGFQPEGGQRILPRSRYFPVNARVDSWLVSSIVELDGEGLGRITARRLANRQVEFGFIPTGGERLLPRSRFFPANAQVDRWLRSSVISLSERSGPVSGESGTTPQGNDQSQPAPYTCVDASTHTPLHDAVYAADAALIRSIAAACPQYLDLISPEYFYDQTPLSLAIGRRNSEAAQILVDAGADPDRRINPAFRVGTHLTYAIGLAETAMARILLDAGADPNAIDTEQFYHQTPLSLAILQADETLLDALLAAGADPNLPISPDFRVGTHLTYAVGLGDVNVVRRLLDAGADANVIDTEQFHDQTPLSLAIKSGDLEMLRALIAAGADPNLPVSPDFRVGAHLTYAVGLGEVAVVRILLDAGADPNVIDTEQFYEESPLSLAVKARDAEMVRALVNAGADPNQTLEQFNDVTPIEIAIEEGDPEILAILQAGVQPGGSQGATGTGTQPQTGQAPSSGTAPNPVDGDCWVGLVVTPGERCAYPGTSNEFTVDAAGNGQFLLFSSGNSLSLLDLTINGARYNFAAHKQADGAWLITTVGS